MDFKMKDFGAVLESRELAKSLAQSILDEHWKHLDDHKRIDFGGIRVVSSFFADSFVDALVNGMGTEVFKESLTLFNLSDMNRIWIDRAIEKHKGAPARVTPPPPPPPAPVKPEKKEEPKPEPKPAPKPPPKPEPKPMPKPQPKPEPVPKAGPKPKAKPEPKPAAPKAKAPAKKPAAKPRKK